MANARWRTVLAGLALTGLAALLLLPGLDTPLLWQDEAETANLAAGVLAHGYPTPWDDAHLVTQQDGRDSVRLGGRLLWAWHPWLQHYLAAAGLGLLGHGTWQARLPFALVALASVPLFFAWRRRRDDLATASVATAIYALSPVFFLFSRQCRYYPLLFLGGLWAVWAYQAQGEAREDGRRAGWAGLGLALALIFYANPLSGLAFAAGLAAHALLAARRGDAPLAPRIRSFALFAGLAAPWLTLVALSEVRTPSLGVAARLELLASQLWRLQYTLLPAVLWPALAWLWLRNRRLAARERARGASKLAGEIELLALLALASWLAVGVAAPLGTARYALALWPLAAVALAALWRALHQRSRLAGSAFLALLLLTDLLPSLPATPVALARPGRTVYDREAGTLDKLAHLGRITAPLPRHLASRVRAGRTDCGPIAATVAVGRALEPPPRLVVAGYGWESLHFYLGAPAVGPDLQRGARRRLGLPPIAPSRADLLVPRRGWPPLPAGLLGRVDFVAVDTGVPDHAYENLPDPTGHRYGPAAEQPAWRPLPPLVVWVRRAARPPDGASTAGEAGCLGASSDRLGGGAGELFGEDLGHRPEPLVALAVGAEEGLGAAEDGAHAHPLAQRLEGHLPARQGGEQPEVDLEPAVGGVAHVHGRASTGRRARGRTRRAAGGWVAPSG